MCIYILSNYEEEVKFIYSGLKESKENRMKLITILKARAAINSHLHDRISYKTAYKLMKFMKASETQEAFYNEKIKELVNLYGKKDENGNFIYKKNSVVLQPEHINDWASAVGELSETDVDNLEIKFMLSDFEEMKISTEEMIALSEFIEEG